MTEIEGRFPSLFLFVLFYMWGKYKAECGELWC